jgi:hypothetical protein
MTEPEPASTDPEAPEADVVEQHTSAAPDVDTRDEVPTEIPLEVDPGDAAEQSREVALDDDAYR